MVLTSPNLSLPGPPFLLPPTLDAVVGIILERNGRPVTATSAKPLELTVTAAGIAGSSDTLSASPSGSEVPASGASAHTAPLVSGTGIGAVPVSYRSAYIHSYVVLTPASAGGQLLFAALLVLAGVAIVSLLVDWTLRNLTSASTVDL